MVKEKRMSERVIRTAKVLAFAVAGLLVGMGLCGLDSHFYPHEEFGGSALAFFGVVAIVLSAVVIAGAVIWLLVLGLSNLVPK